MIAGNAASLLGPSALPGSGPARLVFGLVLVAFVAVWSRRAGMSRLALGLHRARLSVGLALGAVLGSGAAVLGLALLRHPILTLEPITYAPVLGLSAGALAWHVLVALPLAVVLPEELAFRGAVLGALAPSSPLRGVLVSSLAFALWHASIVAPTLRETNVADPFLAALALAGAAAVLFAGGVALALLRLRIGTLASSIAAHWAFNAVLLVGLWLLA